jgi:hypothetical protein
MIETKAECYNKIQINDITTKKAKRKQRAILTSYKHTHTKGVLLRLVTFVSFEVVGVINHFCKERSRS